MSEKNKIAIQGIQSSFHSVAAQKYFGNDIELIECVSFKELCEKLEHNQADYAMMAIENSIAGTLLSNYNLLRDYGFKVLGETFLHIQMYLMALPGTKITDLKSIESHPIAIRQCHEYLWTIKNAELVETADTALSAKEISDKNLENVATIASKNTADVFGLEILKDRIETNKQNFTRFLVLGKKLRHVPKANKASISLHLGHRIGRLAEILTIFSKHQTNLTKIQSIPINGEPYEYMFMIDLEWENYSDFQEATEKVSKNVENLLVMGVYEKGTLDYNEE